MIRTVLAPAATAMLLASLAAPLHAQKPDFSGSWKLNTEKSDPPPQMGGPPGGGARPSGGERPGGGGGPGGGRPGMMTPSELFITQLTSRMTIEQKTAERTRTATYNLDGAESRNPGMMGADFVTTSTWVDNTLVTKGKNTFNTPMGEMTVETTEVRSLSEDGKTMTIEMTSVSPRGTMKRRTLYDKQ